MQDVLIIPTYGFVTSDPSLPGGRGTKARIEVARRLIRSGAVSRNCTVPLPQRALPKGRERELLGGDVPLGKNVGAYLRTLPEFKDACIIDNEPLSSGTFEDTVIGLNQAYYDANSTMDGPIHAHFVSDRSQLGRHWLIWNLAWKTESRYAGEKASFYRVPNNFRSWGEIIKHEVLRAYPKCILLCLRWRFFAT